MADNPYSILNLGPDEFVAALDELGIVGEDRNRLTEQYYAQNRSLPMTSRPEGMKVRNILPIATPEGMTGAEALMSGDFEWAVPEFLRGLYEAPAESINVASAASRGIPVTEEQVRQAGMTVAEMATGIGPATFAGRAMVRGVEMPDPSVVSASGAGSRGMGDNGGPPMPPKRYINPETGLYSPSFEAARSLKQEVGTPQQMRAMLLKAGAKEEELIYSGFDEWLKGKEKVTRQEIEDVLGRAAAGYDFGGVDPYTGFETFPGPMPYVREARTSGGVTGVEGTSLGDLQDEIYERVIEDYNAQRRERLLGELQSRGYSFPNIADEASFADFAARSRQQVESYDLRSGGPRVPHSVYNNVLRVEDLLQRGYDFNSPDVQRIVRQGINLNTDGMISPEGPLTYTFDAIQREFPEEEPALELSRGFMPEDVRDRAYRAYDMSPEEVADYLGIDVQDILDNFNPDDTQYGSYVMPGLRNYSESLFKFDDAGRGVLSGIESFGVNRFRQPHFSEPKAPIMFHTRTGELQTPEGVAYHIAEIQSDIGQTYRKEPGTFFVPGKDSTDLQLSKPERAVLGDYLSLSDKLMSLKSDVDTGFSNFLEKYFNEETGTYDTTRPGYEEASNRVKAARAEKSAAEQALLEFEDKNFDVIQRVSEFYGVPQSFSASRAFGYDFDPSSFKAVLEGTLKPKRGYGLTGKTAALPFATSTNRWVDAALKNEVIAAAKRGAEWITFPMSEDVQKYTGGLPEGQADFYEKIVPMRLKKLSEEFLGGVPIQRIEAKGFGPNAPTYEVNAIRLTPELRAKLLEEGLPSFAKGGPVRGSSLDIDVFAFD